MWKRGNFDFKSKVNQYFSRGLDPREIAMTIALAFVLGIFPLYGITTVLMLLVSNQLRLNTALMVSTGYLFTPLLFVFWIPFIELGQFIFQSPNFEVVKEQLSTISELSWGELVSNFSLLLLEGIFAWVLISPIIYFLTYRVVLFIVLKIQRKQNQFFAKT